MGPAMVIVGSHDHLTPLRLANRVAELLPQAQLQAVDGSGHQVMQEAPRRLAELIDRFAVDTRRGAGS